MHFVYLPADDLLDVETCGRDISVKWLFLLIDFVYNQSIARNMDYVKHTDSFFPSTSMFLRCFILCMRSN